MKKLLLILFLLLSGNVMIMADTYDQVFPAAKDVAPKVKGIYTDETGKEAGYWIDVTPKNFKFYESDLDTDGAKALFVTSLASTDRNNLTGQWITNNIDYNDKPEYQDGIFVIGGNNYSDVIEEGVQADKKTARDGLVNGVSIYDFGGKIGKVLVFNGSNSNLAEEIKENFDLAETPDIPKAASQNGYFQIFAILDKDMIYQDLAFEGSQASCLKVRIEFNVYSANFGSNNVLFQSIDRINNFGVHTGPFTVNANNNYAVDVKSEEFLKYNCDVNNENTSNVEKLDGNKWNPNRWMVYEWDCPFEKKPTDLTPLSGPSAIKFSIPGPGQPLNNSAILIRSIKVYYYGSNLTVQKKNDLIDYGYKNIVANSTTYSVSAVRKTWNDYSRLDYSEPIKIAISHEGEGDIHLSAGEQTQISVASIPSYEDVKLDPEVEYNVSVGDNEYVLLGESGKVKGHSHTLSIHSEADKQTVPLSLSYKDVKSNEISLNHYGAAKSITLDYAKTHGGSFNDENTKGLYEWMEKGSFTQLSYQNGDWQSFQPFIHSYELNDGLALDYDEVAYQDYEVEVYTKSWDSDLNETVKNYVEQDEDGVFTVKDSKERNILSIQKASEKTDGFYRLNIKPLLSEYNHEVYFQIYPLLAGEATQKAKPLALTDAMATPKAVETKSALSKEYKVYLTSDGLSGIEAVESGVEDCGEFELYNLQGVRVVDPAPGIYLRRAANGTVSKVAIR